MSLIDAGATTGVNDPESAGPYQRFKVWKEYETVAMHFNDLLMRLRSQSLGAVAAFAALAGVVVRGDVSVSFRWGTLVGVFALLSLFWVAVWILDIGYYNRLLAGAVRAIIKLEKDSSQSQVSTLNLSTVVAEAAKKALPDEYVLVGAHRWFYITVFIALFGRLVVSVEGVGGVGKLVKIMKADSHESPATIVPNAAPNPRATIVAGPQNTSWIMEEGAGTLWFCRANSARAAPACSKAFWPGPPKNSTLSLSVSPSGSQLFPYHAWLLDARSGSGWSCGAENTGKAQCSLFSVTPSGLASVSAR